MTGLTDCEEEALRVRQLLSSDLYPTTSILTLEKDYDVIGVTFQIVRNSVSLTVTGIGQVWLLPNTKEFRLRFLLLRSFK